MKEDEYKDNKNTRTREEVVEWEGRDLNVYCVDVYTLGVLI